MNVVYAQRKARQGVGGQELRNGGSPRWKSVKTAGRSFSLGRVIVQATPCGYEKARLWPVAIVTPNMVSAIIMVTVALSASGAVKSKMASQTAGAITPLSHVSLPARYQRRDVQSIPTVVMPHYKRKPAP
jgi:hypothetical protein